MLLTLLFRRAPARAFRLQSAAHVLRPAAGNDRRTGRHHAYAQDIRPAAVNVARSVGPTAIAVRRTSISVEVSRVR